MVRNYDKFQHYKDRTPPWIKLYNELLDNYEFSRLQDASKLHLILIWLLASRHNNRLPWDPEWIGKRIGATEPVILEVLEGSGFIQKLPSNDLAITPLALCKQDACLEREVEEEKETEGANAPVLSFWDVGESFGITRPTIGRMVKDYGENAVSEAIRDLSLRNKRPADSTQYVFGILKKRGANGANIYEPA